MDRLAIKAKLLRDLAKQQRGHIADGLRRKYMPDPEPETVPDPVEPAGGDADEDSDIDLANIDDETLEALRKNCDEDHTKEPPAKE